MALDDRKTFYRKRISPSGNIEIDYLRTRINDMKLRTISRFRITAATAGRPDLISQKAYGSYNFGWLIALHNKMMNPFDEYSVGRTINIPSLDDYYKFYNRNSMSETPQPFTPTFREADVIAASFVSPPAPPIIGEIITNPETGATEAIVTSVNGLTGDVIITKVDVTLGNVMNFGVANRIEAEAGTSDTAYMTPLRTYQAMQKFFDDNAVQIINDAVDTRFGNITIDEGDI